MRQSDDTAVYLLALALALGWAAAPYPGAPPLGEPRTAPDGRRVVQVRMHGLSIVEGSQRAHEHLMSTRGQVAHLLVATAAHAAVEAVAAGYRARGHEVFFVY